MPSRCHIDQMNREVWISAPPRRIVSLVPSQTELLIDLGLANQLVGRTQFCIHPAKELANIPRIGGTKKLQIDAIRELKPDLIIGNKEENQKEDIEQLAKEFPVWMSDIQTTSEALSMIHSLGELTATQRKAQAIQLQLEEDFLAIRYGQKRFAGRRVLYAIWKNPWMFVGQETFIHHLLELAGFENACLLPRYPEMSEAEIKALSFDLLLLSSEPFPFAGKHEDDAKQWLGDIDVQLVDGEMFSWYGTRLLHLKSYLNLLATKMA